MPKLMDAKTGMFVKTLKLMAAYISGFTVLGKSLMVISTMGIPLYTKVSPFIMYYGSALLLFTPKVHCLQTFEHRIALWAIKAVKFHIQIY